MEYGTPEWELFDLFTTIFYGDAPPAKGDECTVLAERLVGKVRIVSPDEPVTFDEFAATNLKRAVTWWHPGFPDDDWTILEWAACCGGEAGELENVCKKIRRMQTGHTAYTNRPIEELVAMAAEEIGDVYAYLDLVAQKLGLTVAECAARKFNAVSEREGLPERIRIPGES